MEELMYIHSYVVVERRPRPQAVRPVAVYGPGGDLIGVMAVRRLKGLQVAQPLRCTSRPQRETEQHGREYEFVSLEEMQRRLQGKELIGVGKYKVRLETRD